MAARLRSPSWSCKAWANMISSRWPPGRPTRREARICESTAPGYPVSRKSIELGQIIADVVPGRFRTDKNMTGRPNGWTIDQRSQRNVQIGAVANQRIEKRTAPFTMRVMVRAATIPHDVIATARECETVGLYTRERLRSRPGGSPALGAMAIE